MYAVGRTPNTKSGTTRTTTTSTTTSTSASTPNLRPRPTSSLNTSYTINTTSQNKNQGTLPKNKNLNRNLTSNLNKEMVSRQENIILGNITEIRPSTQSQSQRFSNQMETQRAPTTQPQTTLNAPQNQTNLHQGPLLDAATNDPNYGNENPQSGNQNQPEVLNQQQPPENQQESPPNSQQPTSENPQPSEPLNQQRQPDPIQIQQFLLNNPDFLANLLEQMAIRVVPDEEVGNSQISSEPQPSSEVPTQQDEVPQQQFPRGFRDENVSQEQFKSQFQPRNQQNSTNQEYYNAASQPQNYQENHQNKSPNRPQYQQSNQQGSSQNQFFGFSQQQQRSQNQPQQQRFTNQQFQQQQQAASNLQPNSNFYQEFMQNRQRWQSQYNNQQQSYNDQQQFPRNNPNPNHQYPNCTYPSQFQNPYYNPIHLNASWNPQQFGNFANQNLNADDFKLKQSLNRPMFSNPNLDDPAIFLAELDIFVNSFPPQQQVLQAIRCFSGEANLWAVAIGASKANYGDFRAAFYKDYLGIEVQRAIWQKLEGGKYFKRDISSMCSYFLKLKSQTRLLNFQISDEEFILKIRKHFPEHVDYALFQIAYLPDPIGLARQKLIMLDAEENRKFKIANKSQTQFSSNSKPNQQSNTNNHTKPKSATLNTYSIEINNSEKDIFQEEEETDVEVRMIIAKGKELLIEDGPKTVLGQTPRIAGKIGTLEVNFMLDSGSQISVIDTNTYELLKKRKLIVKEQEADNLKMHGPFGNSKPIKPLTKVLVELNLGKIMTVCVFIVADLRGNSTVLLGDNFFRENHAIVNYNWNFIELLHGKMTEKIPFLEIEEKEEFYTVATISTEFENNLISIENEIGKLVRDSTEENIQYSDVWIEEEENCPEVLCKTVAESNTSHSKQTNFSNSRLEMNLNDVFSKNFASKIISKFTQTETVQTEITQTEITDNLKQEILIKLKNIHEAKKKCNSNLKLKNFGFLQTQLGLTQYNVD